MSVQKTEQLKQLKKREVKLRNELVTLDEEKREAQRKYSSVLAKHTEIRGLIFSIMEQSKEIVITDHALVRYMERVLGNDTEKIRKDILSSTLEYQIKKLGNGSYPIAITHKAIVKDMSIISIV